MNRCAHLDIDAHLTITGGADAKIEIEAQGRVISVALPSFWTGRRIAKHMPNARARNRWIRALQLPLRTLDLSMELRVSNRVVAVLRGDSRGSLLSRLLGLGTMELKPLAMLVAGFQR